MTTAQDLSGNWSVTAFHDTCARAHLDLHRLPDDDLVPALVRVGALRPGWPDAVARRLALTLLFAVDWRDTLQYRDTLFTDARGRLVYHDGFDDLRIWMMEELGVEEEDESVDPPGSLRPLLAHVSMPRLVERLGPDRMAAFVTRVREEGAGPGTCDYYYFRRAAALGRYGGLKFEDVAMLEQANRDEAEARAREETER